jgi:site-specific recombinase XerD
MRYYLFLKNFTLADGARPVVLRYYANYKQADISMNISALPDQWDESKCRLKKKHPQAVKLNLILDSAQKRADEILFKAKLAGETISASEFRDLFTNAKGKTDTLLALIGTVIDEGAGKMADTTLRNYRNFRNKIEDFSKDATIREANTLAFIERFEKYMQKAGGLSRNGRNKQHATLRAVLQRAVAKGLADRNAYTGYRMSYEKVKMEYLTMRELSGLHSYMDNAQNPAGQRDTCRAFLFCCYTGLRYSDIHALRHADITTQQHGGQMRKAVRVVQQKTGEEVIIPLSSRAMELMPTGTGIKEEKVFRIMVNQVVNRHLKEISDACGFMHRDIHFHTSRHTFATLSLSLGIDIKTVSKLLGHTKVATTEVYAKVMDANKFTAMDAWG